jgi:hypothetical protein
MDSMTEAARPAPSSAPPTCAALPNGDVIASVMDAPKPFIDGMIET